MATEKGTKGVPVRRDRSMSGKKEKASHNLWRTNESGIYVNIKKKIEKDCVMVGR